MTKTIVIYDSSKYGDFEFFFQHFSPFSVVLLDLKDRIHLTFLNVPKRAFLMREKLEELNIPVGISEINEDT